MLGKNTWSDIKATVKGIADTENSYMFNYGTTEIPVAERFSTNGLSQLGSKIGFPAPFVTSLGECGHKDLANEIIARKMGDYFAGQKKTSDLFFREFGDSDGVSRIHGVLSEKYSVFDDTEVCDILESSKYLMDAQEIWSNVSADHMHLRFISKEKLNIAKDKSPLSMAVFVDNSMVGRSMLRIRFGLYRWACTNGMISDFKEFCIIRERHLGAEKDWTRIVAEALIDVKRYEAMLIDRVNNMAENKSSIYNMTEEDAIRYIKDKLNTSKKRADEILTVYNTVYGGFSQWDLCNAITEVAHNVECLDTRLLFESKAMRVA